MSDGDVTVLYIAGVNRSGSTLLDRTTGQMPGHWSVGEMGSFIWRLSLLRDWPCGCGKNFLDCPFWSEVGQIAFGGWNTLDVDKLRSLQLEVDRTARIPLLVLGGRLPSFRSKLDEYARVLQKIYAAVQEVSGASVIVDSSKHPSTAYLLRRTPGIRLAVVHNVRDPRGVVYSWSKTDLSNSPDAQKDGAAGVMPTWTARHTCRHYVTTNLLVGWLARLGVPVIRVRYEDYVRDPAASLRRVAAAVGTPVQDFEFLRDNEVELQLAHTAAGNPGRFKTGWVAIRPDEGWRDGLPKRKQWFALATTWPLRRRYGYRAR